jgi:hypothetical protein
MILQGDDGSLSYVHTGQPRQEAGQDRTKGQRQVVLHPK